MDKKLKQKIRLVLIITVVLSFSFIAVEMRSVRVRDIQRNSYGKGSKKETFEVIVADERLEETVDIEVGERRYSEEEVKKIFRRTMDELERIVLGNNKTVDHVEEDLNMIRMMPDKPIAVTWETSRSDIINSFGEIQEENLTENGELVELRGLLNYGEQECLYVVNVMVYPKTLTGEEGILKRLKGMAAEADERSREEQNVQLPKEIDGQAVIWEREKEYKGVWILALGVAAAFMVWLQEKQKLQKEKADREKQMRLDYPEIVSQISLLVGAGMTVKNAWGRIIGHYRERQGNKEGRYAYEEMENTLREMQSGITEAECYERFGRRCGIACYMKLGTLLSQNLRKGTKGLVEVLARETGQALEERRQTAKRQGEETGTKLLLPMSLMLVVVLIIVIVPAFLSITF